MHTDFAIEADEARAPVSAILGETGRDLFTAVGIRTRGLGRPMGVEEAQAEIASLIEQRLGEGTDVVFHEVSQEGNVGGLETVFAPFIRTPEGDVISPIPEIDGHEVSTAQIREAFDLPEPLPSSTPGPVGKTVQMLRRERRDGSTSSVDAGSSRQGSLVEVVGQWLAGAGAALLVVGLSVVAGLFVARGGS